jgi:hypothetical protein
MRRHGRRGRGRQQHRRRRFVEIAPEELVGKTIESMEHTDHDRGLDITMKDGTKIQLRPPRNAGYDSDGDGDATECNFYVSFQGGPFQVRIPSDPFGGVPKGDDHPSGVDISALVGHTIEDALFFDVRNNSTHSRIYKALRFRFDDWPVVEARMEQHDHEGGEYDWEWKHGCSSGDMDCFAPPRVSLETIKLLRVEES